MNIFTNNAVKVVSLVAVLAFSFIIEAKPSKKTDQKVNVKCFVELVGGGEMVSFWSVPQNKVSNLSKSIVGHKVMLPNSKQKIKIYKAHACVLLKDDFTDSRARIVDEKTAR
jgi:hypothetical protein